MKFSPELYIQQGHESVKQEKTKALSYSNQKTGAEQIKMKWKKIQLPKPNIIILFWHFSMFLAYSGGLILSLSMM